MREGALKLSDVHLPGVVDAELQGASADKLAEIWAQETRLSTPDDVLRRRVRSQMPPGDGTRAARATAWGSGVLGAAVGHTPRTSLGRNRWSVPVEDAAPLLPEETAAMVAKREVAQRALAAGTRALLYGSAVAVVGLIVGARVAAHALDIHSEQDLRDRTAEVRAGHCALPQTQF